MNNRYTCAEKGVQGCTRYQKQVTIHYTMLSLHLYGTMSKPCHFEIAIVFMQISNELTFQTNLKLKAETEQTSVRDSHAKSQPRRLFYMFMSGYGGHYFQSSTAYSVCMNIMWYECI